MATVNLGRIKPVFRGAYAGGTAYVVDDIVTHGNESFICIQAGTGNATSNASYWTKLAAKGSDGTDVGAILNNKEILGLRIFTIPIEDAFYAHQLILLNLFFYKKFSALNTKN